MAEFKPDDYSEIRFADDDHEALMEFTRLLLRCSTVSDRQRRASILHLLPNSIRFNINEADAPFVQIIEIVRTCNSYENGINKLLRAIYYIEGETTGWGEVEIWLVKFKKNSTGIFPLQAMPAPTPATEFDRLLELLAKAETNADWDEVIRLGNLLLKLDPGSRAVHIRTANAYYKRGDIYAEENNYKQALEDANRAIELNPNLAKAYHLRGHNYIELKEYDKALNSLNKAIQIDPNFAVAYSSRGVTYYYLKEYKKAIANYDKAIEINPNLATAYYNRGNAYISLKEYHKAIADCDQAISLNPNYALTYNNRGFAYSELKEYQRAIADYNKAIELKPSLIITYNNRGNVYVYLREYYKALADYDYVIQFDPEFTLAYYGRGVAYERLKEYQWAIKEYNKVIELQPGFAEAYYRRGTAWEQLGISWQADQDKKRAKELGYYG